MQKESQMAIVAAHMMRSVSERYALLLKVGFPFDYLSRRNLEGSPNLVAGRLLGKGEGIVNWMGQVSGEGEELIQRLLAEPLPEGIFVGE